MKHKYTRKKQSKETDKNKKSYAISLKKKEPRRRFLNIDKKKNETIFGHKSQCLDIKVHNFLFLSL